MPKYMQGQASDPGCIVVSRKKLEEFITPTGLKHRLSSGLFRKPDPKPYNFDRIQEHMIYGDSRAAVVMATKPHLLVAVYTDELDCVRVMRFHNRYIKRYGLKVGSPLLTVNTYMQGDTLAPDLTPGPLSTGRFVEFNPIIADFITDDYERVAERKHGISQQEWDRAYTMGVTFLREKLGLKPQDA